VISPALYITATGIDGQIWLKVYRGPDLVIETPLRTRQALALLADLANLVAATDVR
jgi:hypothetical protein